MPSELYLRGPVASLEICHNHHDAHIGSYEFLPPTKLYQTYSIFFNKTSPPKIADRKKAVL